MTTSLQSLQHIQSTTMVRWKVYEYRANYGDFPNVQTLRFSDSLYDIDVTEDGGSVTYTGLGPLLSYSRSKEQVRATGDKFTIGLSGIPETSIVSLLASGVKGSEISLFRQIQYPGTNSTITDLDHPRGSNGIVGRFAGYVNTYTVNDDIIHSTDVRLVEIVLDCVNLTSNIRNKVRGIRTNPEDLALFNASDPSFDNVPALSQQPWYFGMAAT